ncbi:MAG: peptidyl-prolyl cis-trans isomerase, partial [Actinomycetota bacterium]|nr:peptidyl-prolyl cis-trans isomerase [Actinomycetota bacterium]
GKTDPTKIDAAIAEFRGTGVDTFGTKGAASVVSSIVDSEVSSEALKRAGGKVTKADRDKVRKAITDQIAQQGITKTASFKALIDFETERAARRQALQKALTKGDREANLRAAYEAQKASFLQLCVEPIITADKAAADAALTRIRAGEDFAKVATEASLQPKSGNPAQDTPCVARANLAGLFGNAANGATAGAILGPAEAQGQPQAAGQAPPPSQWLVVRVATIQPQTFEQVRPQLEQAIPDPTAAAVSKALAAAIKRADVTVDPRYGTWNPRTGVVDPPRVPGATTTTTLPIAPTGKGGRTAPTAPAGSGGGAEPAPGG